MRGGERRVEGGGVGGEAEGEGWKGCGRGREEEGGEGGGEGGRKYETHDAIGIEVSVY